MSRDVLDMLPAYPSWYHVAFRTPGDAGWRMYTEQGVLAQLTPEVIPAYERMGLLKSEVLQFGRKRVLRVQRVRKAAA